MNKKPLTKQEWQNILNKLNTLFNDFNTNFSFSKSGRNSKIRNEAEQKFMNAIRDTKELIYQNQEAYYLFVADKNIGQASAEMFHDLNLPEYFKTDISNFLINVKTKIQSIEDTL